MVLSQSKTERIRVEDGLSEHQNLTLIPEQRILTMYRFQRPLFLMAFSSFIILLCFAAGGATIPKDSVSELHRGIEIRSLNLISSQKRGAHLRLNTSATVSPHLSYMINGDLQIILPNTHIAAKIENTLQTINHSDIMGVQLVQGYPRSGDISITVMSKHLLGFVMEKYPHHISFVIRKRVSHSGALEGKLVVVDPGHGGHELGAVYDGYDEKNITLQMGIKLRRALEHDGATVVMTRDRDVYVGLNARPDLANELDADYFISIHNNSDHHPNVASGTMTFYHMQEPSSKNLAMAVQKAVVKVSGLHGYGALSDSTLYNIGLAVLRGSNMPAVLVEVAFINNRIDRAKLINPRFQKRVMTAIVHGLIDYNSNAPHAPALPFLGAYRKSVKQ